MGSLPRRVTYAVLGALLFLNVALRIPDTVHESGVDSFVFHGLTQALVDQGHAAWLLNPLSLLGLYPLSHPSGPVILSGGIAETIGMSVEGSVLVLDMLVSVVGLLGAFVMAREIRADDRFALLVAFLMSTAPRFVATLSWEMPTRSMFTALVPVFVWAVLRLHRRVSPLELGLLGVILVIMMSAHRLTVIMSIVLVAYVVASIFLAAARLLRTAYASTFFRHRVRRAMRVGAWSLVGFTAMYALLFSGVLDAYQRGQIGTGTGLLVQLQNLGVSLARSSGLLLPLAFVGILAVSRSRAPDVREPWLIATLVGILPTLGLRQYTGYYLVPFAAIFIGLGILHIHQALAKRPRLRLGVAVGLLALSLVSTGYIVSHEREVEQGLPMSIYDGAVYQHAIVEGTFVSNSGIIGVQIHSLSGSAYMPIGGATTAAQGPEILAFGFLRPQDMRVRLISLGSLTIEDDSFFVLDGVNFEAIWADMMSRPLPDNYVQNTLRTYHLETFIERRATAGSFEAYSNLYGSPFSDSVHESRYAIFQNQDLVLFSL